MVVTVGLGILATRWALHTLGKVDFGIWAGLTATVGVLLVISDGVGEAVERFLAFEIGRGDPKRQREFFGTALTVMLIAGAVVLVLGLPLGQLVISTTLGSDEAIPATRLSGAGGAPVWWAFTTILAGLCLQIVGTPFRSMFRAHQSMALLTVIDTLDSVLKLLAVVVAMRAPAGADPLLYLCVAALAGQVATTLAVAALCLRTYPDSRAGVRHFSRPALHELGRFTGWSMLGTVSYRLRMSGTQMLLLTFGSAITGAYAIALQVAGYQLNISAALGKAVQPAIVQASGRGDLLAVRRLIPSLNKLATLLAMFYLVPLIIETEAVLNLWLNRPGRESHEPMEAETPTFVRLVLLIMGLPWLYSGYHAAMMADGRIKHYMISAVLMEAAGLGIAIAAVVWFGAPATAVPMVTLGTAIMAMCYWVIHISGVLKIPLAEWLTKTWLPVLLVGVPAVAAAMIPRMLMAESFVRVLAVTAVYGVSAVPLVWVFGLNGGERPHIERVLRAGAAKLGLVRAEEQQKEADRAVVR